MNIHIQNYPVFIRLGYFEEERLCGQEALVSLDLNLGKIPGIVSEDLAKTTDYGKILEKIEEVLAYKEIRLLEAAVEILGEALLRSFSQVKSVRIHIEKCVLPKGVGKGAKISASEFFSREEQELL